MQNDPVLQESSTWRRIQSGAANALVRFVQVHWEILSLLVLAAIVLLPGLGSHPLVSWDEAIYAEISKEFLILHSWLTPHWNYQPWMEKPPLFLWVTAVFFKVFGISEFWARAASAFSGIGVVAVTYLCAKELKDSRLGWIAAFLLLTIRGFLQMGRNGKTDMMLTLWMFVGLYGVLLLIKGRRAGWYLFWCGSALAVMTKSAAVAPVFLTLAVLVIVRRDLFGVISKQFFMGLGLFVLIVAPWHIYMVSHFGDAFLDQYLGRHVLERSMSPLENNHEGVSYYPILLLKWVFPWILVVPIGYWIAFRQKTLNVFHYFALIILLFYTLVQTKVAHYVEPIYPALAIVAAMPIYDWIRSWRTERVLQAGFAMALIAGLVCLPILENHIAAEYGSPVVDLIRAHPVRGYNGPLLLCSDRVMITLAAPLFYAPSKTEQVYLDSKPMKTDSVRIDPKTIDKKYWHPVPLTSELNSTPDLIVISKELLPRLPASSRFRPIAGTTEYELGMLAVDGSKSAAANVKRVVSGR
ncbi:MAG TPA: glycosyltransferase family 39 protein [Bryobacteraceae bacterium]|nr:glycosyltransferase family 39 protein [Bryobacteraceae bacterium]